MGLPFSFFCVFFVFFFEREISKHQVSRRTPYPYNYAAADSNRRECAHCCCWGWFWVLMRAPDCLDPSLKSELPLRRSPHIAEPLLSYPFVSLYFLSRRVSKEGVPSHGTNLGFTSADLLEGFSSGACPFHGTCLDFTSLYWLMWFDSLPLLGPGGLAIFFFCVFFCFFSRERDIKAPGFPAYPLSLQLCSCRFKPA